MIYCPLSVISTQQILPGWCFPTTGLPLCFPGSVFPLPTGVQGYSLWGSGPPTQIPLNPTKSIFYLFHVSLHYLTHMIKCHSCLSRRRPCQANQKMYGPSNYVRETTFCRSIGFRFIRRRGQNAVLWQERYYCSRHLCRSLFFCNALKQYICLSMKKGKTVRITESEMGKVGRVFWSNLPQAGSSEHVKQTFQRKRVTSSVFPQNQ